MGCPVAPTHHQVLDSTVLYCQNSGFHLQVSSVLYKIRKVTLRAFAGILVKVEVAVVHPVVVSVTHRSPLFGIGTGNIIAVSTQYTI